jgi:hypothetical protein
MYPMLRTTGIEDAHDGCEDAKQAKRQKKLVNKNGKNTIL